MLKYNFEDVLKCETSPTPDGVETQNLASLLHVGNPSTVLRVTK